MDELMTEHNEGVARLRELEADPTRALAFMASARNLFPLALDVIEAAGRLVNGQYGLASGVVAGPDPKPEDFTYYVPGQPLADLDFALEAFRAAAIEEAE